MVIIFSISIQFKSSITSFQQKTVLYKNALSVYVMKRRRKPDIYIEKKKSGSFKIALSSIVLVTPKIYKYKHGTMDSA